MSQPENWSRPNNTTSLQYIFTTHDHLKVEVDQTALQYIFYPSYKILKRVFLINPTQRWEDVRWPYHKEQLLRPLPNISIHPIRRLTSYPITSNVDILSFTSFPNWWRFERSAYRPFSPLWRQDDIHHMADITIGYIQLDKIIFTQPTQGCLLPQNCKILHFSMCK